MLALAALNLLPLFPCHLLYPSLIGLSWLAWLVGRVEPSHRPPGLKLSEGLVVFLGS